MGGAVNLTNTVLVRTEKVGGDTMLANMYRFVRAAQKSKPSIQRVADYAASIFVPVNVVYAVCVLFGWSLLGLLDIYPAEWRPHHDHHHFQGPLSFARSFFLSTLVVACPCAMGLSTPTAVMVGTGVGALRGVLIKGGEAIERTGKVQTVLFDKTGTLTLGKMRVAQKEDERKDSFKKNLRIRSLQTLFRRASCLQIP